jgi:alcohol dehydrogenase (NADP+)
MGYPETAEGFMIHDHKKWYVHINLFAQRQDADNRLSTGPTSRGASSSSRSSKSTMSTLPLRLVVFALPIFTPLTEVGVTLPSLFALATRSLARSSRSVTRSLTARSATEVRTVLHLLLGFVLTTIPVGVGAQIGADLTCDNCKADQENYCPNSIDTYGAPYPDGTISQGGYASHIRANDYFVFKIPDNIETSIAAPMLCAGLTVYSPLVRLGAGPGKKVGIIGIGGLGHFALLWAKALGAEVYAISHSPNKKEDALKMGAKEFICTKEKGWNEPYKFAFDFVINTADAIDQFNLDDYFSTLKVWGKFHMVGFGDKPIPTLMAQQFAGNGCSIGASHIGNRPEMEAMFELASKQNIKSWVETIDVSEEGCKTALERLDKGDIKYRFTLVNFDKVFGKRS